MNIRDHIRKAITGGLAANFTQQAGLSGIVFHDENEFIPFTDLNYNNEFGYYRLSLFPDLPRDCTNENQDTIHHGKDFHDWKPLIWADSGGNLTMLGDAWNAADLYQALKRFFETGTVDAEEISENDPAWDYMRRMDWAIKEYRDILNPINQSDRQIGNTIRAAASRGAIRGCSQSEAGNWHFRPPAFRGWLVKTRDETRGRPRKETAQPTVDFMIEIDGDLPSGKISELLENFTGDTRGLQHNLAAMARQSTGKIPRGQLWQPCERPGCDNEPACMNCLCCEEEHCECVFE